MNSVIIDNCIISQLNENGLRIRPISLEKKSIQLLKRLNMEAD
jgi:hypothetical protein